MGASAWVRIYKALRQGFPDSDYRTGTTVLSVDQDAVSVTVTLSDGSRESGDLLVAAEMDLSTVKREGLTTEEDDDGFRAMVQAFVDDTKNEPLCIEDSP